MQGALHTQIPNFDHHLICQRDYCASRIQAYQNNCNPFLMHQPQFRTDGVCVVISCTARKRRLGSPTCPPPASVQEPLLSLARSWVDSTRGSQARVKARDLYLGRAFREGCLAAKSAEAKLFVASAGFGLVSDTTLLPNYNLTVSEGSGSIRPHLQACGSSAADWWQRLNEVLGHPNPISELIRSATFTRVLIAMPSTYLDLLADDLASVPRELIKQFQIFTSRAGLETLPVHVRDCVMPYDERLELVTGFAGTKADFAQRALRHFVEIVNGHRLTWEQSASAVESSLGAPVAPRRSAGAKATDSEIQQLLLSQWDAKGGGAARLLRFLRDEAYVACEQKRFQRIWHTTKASRSA